MNEWCSLLATSINKAPVFGELKSSDAGSDGGKSVTLLSDLPLHPQLLAAPAKFLWSTI